MDKTLDTILTTLILCGVLLSAGHLWFFEPNVATKAVLTIAAAHGLVTWLHDYLYEHGYCKCVCGQDPNCDVEK